MGVVYDGVGLGFDRKLKMVSVNDYTVLAPRCRSAAQRLLNRYDWSLLDADALARRAAGLPRPGGQQAADHACLQAYAAELHRVIAGHDETPPSSSGCGLEQAFTELWRYLLPIAQRKTENDRSQEFAQRTLVIVWEKRGQCRYPTSFLGWATLILNNEIRQDYRKRTRPVTGAGDADTTAPRREARVELLDDLGRGGEEREWHTVLPADIAPADAALVHEQAHQRLLDTLSRVLSSEQQTAVIVALFLQERNPVEVADELGCTVHNVYVLKSRALKRLRGNSEVMAALVDLV